MKITIDDVRRSGQCVLGAKEWAKNYPQIDFKLLMSEGIDEEVALSTQDAYAIMVVKEKRERLKNGGIE